MEREYTSFDTMADANTNLLPFTLALASPHGDIANPKTWSGTPSRIFQRLKPRFAAGETINYRLSSRADFVMRATSRLFRGWNCTRNGWFNGAFERQFRAKWDALPFSPDACLHISDFCIPENLPGRAKHFIYTDSTLPGVASYQPRPVRAGFLKSYRNLTRDYLKRVELVFTLNEWTRQSYIAEHGFPADRIINARFGINITPWHEPKDFSRRLMLIVLRPKLEEIKGLNLLLAALPEVRRVMPDVELAVVGTQLDPCPPWVTCYFNQPREKTIELMRTATLFAMPALCEANGIVYPEALASRTPILGLDRLAFPEFAGGGEFGFIVREAEPDACARAIIEAFRDSQRLQRMGEDGQRFVLENYSWERTAQIMAEAMGTRLS